MKETIQKELKQIEREKGIKILFAIENGSRAWNMQSTDSDYDIRFVYIKPVREYVSLKQGNGVIDFTVEERDYVGFDIKKYTSLLSKSNPTAVEWATSPIVYHGKQPDEFVYFANNCNKIALHYHYMGMCKQNYMKYIKGKRSVGMKKILYAMRGLMNALWVTQKKTNPPFDLFKCVEQLKLPDLVKAVMLTLIDIKKESNEEDNMMNTEILTKFIEDNLRALPPKEGQSPDRDVLDFQMIEMVMQNE